jgi:glutamate 5-kinase
MSPASLKYSRLVIKIGAPTLTGGTAHLAPPMVLELVRQIAQLHQKGHEIIIVSSGAIAAGRERQEYPQLPKNIPAKQMLASIGQLRLMTLYEDLFTLYDIIIAQVLLTRADLADRRGYLNSRNTLAALLEQHAIPIVNENDTVATEEIRLGDNDNLSALVTNLVEANLLVLLTDQSGLFTANPRLHPEATLVSEVHQEKIPPELWEAAGGTANGLGTGGMLTKLQAADLARRSGAEIIIANGSEPDVLLRLVAGEQIGTHFYPVVSALESRKRYILAGGKGNLGKLRIDRGAAQALPRGGSLLPVGVLACEGQFERGDRVRIIDAEDYEIARGLANYSASDLKRIMGLHSESIESILGYLYGEEVIHRNNMILL